jgi:folate-dependent phosphoribosylglycinamide formyltransferase PurN
MFLPSVGRRYRAALFLSGVGSNAELLLERQDAAPSAHFEIVLLVTDAPGTSRAAALAARFGTPLAALDIRAFYLAHGIESISLATAAGRDLRRRWTDELRRLIAPYRPDFGILAGFVPLTNLTSDFPCLNVHPADLTVVAPDGRRLLAGLHAKPMETALCLGLTRLRSSVIVAQSYTGSGGEMDSGPILGVSAPVEAEMDGLAPDELAAIRSRRTPGRKPADALAQLAARNLERLKRLGDHVVLPRAVEAFAAGRYAMEGVQLYWRPETGDFQAVETVEYGIDFARPLTTENVRRAHG